MPSFWWVDKLPCRPLFCDCTSEVGYLSLLRQLQERFSKSRIWVLDFQFGLMCTLNVSSSSVFQKSSMSRKDRYCSSCLRCLTNLSLGMTGFQAAAVDWRELLPVCSVDQWFKEDKPVVDTLGRHDSWEDHLYRYILLRQNDNRPTFQPRRESQGAVSGVGKLYCTIICPSCAIIADIKYSY